jgi:hypothetical protein
MPELRVEVDEAVWQALQRQAGAAGTPVAVLVDRALRELLGVETHSLYQVSTAGALVEGLYQGAVSVGVVREHGDFGLGTFEELDGEMVVLDGIAYRVGGDGAVTVVDDEAGTPFAVVTRFDPAPSTRSGRSTTSAPSPPPSTGGARRTTCSSPCGWTATSTGSTCGPPAGRRRACPSCGPRNTRRSGS